MAFPARLLSTLLGSDRIVALTGAGVSQESGLRTFRDAQSGLWSQYRPEDLASPEAFRRDPQLVWDWYAWRRLAIEGVRPNAGHYALAEMARQIKAFTLITQNVDGLHEVAGSPDPVELHGNIRRVRCSKCNAYPGAWDTSGTDVPHCERCGGLLRPDVVWFGEPLPRDALERAFRTSAACQVFLSVGTSGLVQPAASLPYAAQHAGALVVEINPEATPLSPTADYCLRGKSGDVLPALVRALWAPVTSPSLLS